jgi:hypothetical protein
VERWSFVQQRQTDALGEMTRGANLGRVDGKIGDGRAKGSSKTKLGVADGFEDAIREEEEQL